MDKGEEKKYWEHDFIFELLKELPSYIFWKNRECVYLGCNDAFAKSLGLSSPEEIKGKTDFDLPTKKEESEAYRADDKEVMDSGKPKLNIEESQTLPDGRKITLLTNKVPLFNKDNEVIGILGIYSDISELKHVQEDLRLAKEAAEAANDAKQEFLYNMRHDIRTPFTGILGLSESLAENEEDPEKKEYLHYITQAAQELLDYLNEILEFTQFRSGMIPILAKRFSLTELIDGIISSFKPAAVNKHLKLVKYYKAPEYVIGDQFRVQRILMNLVGNAIKFTPSGQITISIENLKEEDKKLILQLSVVDTGIGIPPEKYNAIFEQFNRLTSSYSGVYKGIGLGLRTVRQMVEELGGEIQVQSKVGKGSAFVCILPFRKPLLENEYDQDFLARAKLAESVSLIKTSGNVSASKKSDKKTENDISEFAGTHILLVEDNELAQRAAIMKLGELNCLVDLASDGQSALEKVKQNQYALIFMDIGLPDINGCQVTKQLRAQEKKTGAHTPIVALTANTDDTAKRDCSNAGMDAVYAKPLTAKKAKEAIRKWVLQSESTVEFDKSLSKKERKDEKAIDLELGAEVMGSVAAAKDILNIFVKSLPDERQAIDDAFSKKNWDDVIAVVHKFHGGCAYCGVPKLKATARYIVDELRKGNTSETQVMRKKILTEIDAVLHAYESLKQDIITPPNRKV